MECLGHISQLALVVVCFTAINGSLTQRFLHIPASRITTPLECTLKTVSLVLKEENAQKGCQGNSKQLLNHLAEIQLIQGTTIPQICVLDNSLIRNLRRNLCLDCIYIVIWCLITCDLEYLKHAYCFVLLVCKLSKLLL